MTQFINAVVNRPVTDTRHFSSVLLADPAVLHAWTMIQSKAYRDPVTNQWKIPARKGGVPMTSSGQTASWSARGDYMVTTYPGTATDDFSAVIPNPGNVVSVLINCFAPNAFTAAGALLYSGMNIGFQPRRSATSASIRVNSTVHDIGFPVSGTKWFRMAAVVDFTNSVLAFHAGNAWAQKTAIAGLTPRADATVRFVLGEITDGIDMDGGMVSDAAIIAGDVRQMPSLLAAWDSYNATAYGA